MRETLLSSEAFCHSVRKLKGLKPDRHFFYHRHVQFSVCLSIRQVGQMTQTSIFNQIQSFNQLCSVSPQGRLQSQDSGKHLHDVLDLLQKHTLVEADISAQAERNKAVQGAAQRFTSHEQGEVARVSCQTKPTPPQVQE